MTSRLVRRLLTGSGVCILFFTSSLSLFIRSERPLFAQSQTSGLPADLAAFIEAQQTKLQANGGSTVKELGQTPNTLKWLDYRAGNPRWKLTALPEPALISAQRPTPNAYLAIFHDYHTCESIGDHIHRLVKTDEGWKFGQEILETDTLGYRVRDHNLNVKLDTANGTCVITDEVQVERMTAAPNSLCLLRLSSVMTVDSVQLQMVDGRKRQEEPFAYQAAPGVIALILPGKKSTVSLSYHGALNQKGWDSYIRSNEVVMSSYWYPHIARLPTKSTVAVTVPKGWTGVTTGEPVDNDERRHSTVFTFRNEIPICYLTLDAGPYIITTRQVGGRRLSTYQLKANPTGAKDALDRLVSALAFFEKHFGPFPYTHYEMVETYGPFGGALEGYSFATFDMGTLGANVHELSHTWWGGIVPNPYTKSQWNESFADYSDSLYERMKSSKPTPALRGVHSGSDYGRGLLQQYHVPVAEAFDTANGAHDSVGYGKGAQVLEMLEDLLGTESMLRCVRRFRDDHLLGEAAEWPDFERAVLKTTGKDYGWFFAQWLNRSDLPIVKLANVRKSGQSGHFTVQAEIVQEGRPYRLLVPVLLGTADGKDIRKTVIIEGGRALFSIVSASEPKVLRLDPDGTLLLVGAKAAEDKGEPFSYRF